MQGITSYTSPLPPRSPPTSRRRKLAYALSGGIAVVVVVVVLILTGVLPLIPATVIPKVTVTQANLSFSPSGNPCFGTYADDAPVTLDVGGQETFFVNLTDQSPNSAHDCTVGDIQVLTPGFSLVSSNAPLSVPTSGVGELTFTVKYPSTAYHGPLNMSAPVTYFGPNIHVATQNFSWSTSPSSCGVEDVTGGNVNITAFAGETYNDSVGFFVISPENYCIIDSVGTSTPGFSVISSSTPYQLPIDSIAGVSFELQLPAQAYTGGLNITLSLTVQSG